MRHLDCLLPLAEDRKSIGVLLGLENNRLKCIGYDYNGKAKDCLQEMLALWLKHAFPPTTWNELAEAVEDAGHLEVARKIQQT